MRNLNPEKNDTGTRLATPSDADVPCPSATKEIGDVCTRATSERDYQRKNTDISLSPIFPERGGGGGGGAALHRLLGFGLKNNTSNGLHSRL